MGACFSDSSMSPEQARALAEEQQKSKALEASLASSHEQQAKIIKLLFLGAGESGKSTLFKQMQLLYGTGFSADVCSKSVPDLHFNVIDAMQTLINQSTNSSFEPDVLQACKLGASVQEAAEALRSLPLVPMPPLTPELAEYIELLWRDSGIRATYAQRSRFQLPDSASYLFDRVIEMSKPDYLPSKSDFLRMRVRTTGVITQPLTIRDKQFQIIDVGGQRSERKKWFNQFSNVTAVIFVTAISEFDQKLYEDDQTNRLQESLDLFDSTVNNPDLKNPAMILFLNKLDLFAQKVAFQHSKIKPHFPEFPEELEGNVDEAKEFIADMFRARNRRVTRKEVYVHFTTAIETDHMQKIFESTQDIILHNSLIDNGLLE